MNIGKRAFIFIVLVLAVLASASCMAKRNTNVAMIDGVTEEYQWNVDESENEAGRAEDARITSVIKTMFTKDTLLSSSHINVDTVKACVTLNGEVSTQIKANHAAQLARSIEGVKRVRSNLIVQNSTKHQ